MLWAEYSYSTSFHITAKSIPFNLVYERDPLPLLHYEETSPTFIEDLENSLVQRDEIGTLSVGEKLSPRHFSPYEVLQQAGLVAYKMQLSAEAAIH